MGENEIKESLIAKQGSKINLLKFFSETNQKNFTFSSLDIQVLYAHIRLNTLFLTSLKYLFFFSPLNITTPQRATIAFTTPPPLHKTQQPFPQKPKKFHAINPS